VTGVIAFPVVAKKIDWNFCLSWREIQLRLIWQYTGRHPMRRLGITLAATAAIVLATSFSWQAEAQISRGALTLPHKAQNFSPIEKAACGPNRGPHCGPFHHWVCGPYGHRCWCARC
jgi:hypothetical protein